jgi:hypothetical protein
MTSIRGMLDPDAERAAEVRAAFDIVLGPHRAADGSIDVPISVKVAAATRR